MIFPKDHPYSVLGPNSVMVVCLYINKNIYNYIYIWGPCGNLKRIQVHQVSPFIPTSSKSLITLGTHQLRDFGISVQGTRSRATLSLHQPILVDLGLFVEGSGFAMFKARKDMNSTPRRTARLTLQAEYALKFRRKEGCTGRLDLHTWPMTAARLVIQNVPKPQTQKTLNTGCGNSRGVCIKAQSIGVFTRTGFGGDSSVNIS